MWILHHQVLESSRSVVHRGSLVGESPLHEFLVVAYVAQVVELLVGIAVAVGGVLLVLYARAMESRI